MNALSFFIVQIVREKYGVLEYIDLIPDGGNTSVTLENRYHVLFKHLLSVFNVNVADDGFQFVCSDLSTISSPEPARLRTASTDGDWTNRKTLLLV